MQSYSTELLISAKPELVYTAITQHINQWWTELSNPATQVGDQLVVRFEKTTYWKMIVTEAIPNQSLVWKVIEAHHELDDISVKDEWKDTTISWNLSEDESGSKVTFIHEGLLPALECYEICEAGWGYFLQSLKNYLETGAGHPYRDS